MSARLVLSFFACAVFTGCALPTWAQFFAPEWKATVRVIDESGRPVSGANVRIGYQVPPGPDESIAIARKSGLTDTNGIFRASKRSRSVDIVFEANKTGYYESSLRHELGYQYDPIKWNPTGTLVLKKIVQPIRMHAKRVSSDVPAFDKPVGYDLSAGDWVAPYGKGTSSDMLFTAHLDKRAEHDWDHKLVITFPNPGDGIQPFTLPKGEETSAFRWPYEAPTNGYRSSWVKTRSRQPVGAYLWQYDKLRFFTRVRTVLDEQGNVTSAHYGKIYGDFMGFSYYFNPVANSRNIEFNPKQNPFRSARPSASDVVEP